ncbi:MAG: ASPIC/UnbV domain-containing protein [Bacteroidota bacterium]
MADAPIADGFERRWKRSGGVWGDLNNDGLLDFLVASSCRCSYADLFVRAAGGEFENKTFEYGLYRLTADGDATLADFNNDGRLDLAIIQDGHLRVFRNQMPDDGNHYAELDLHDVGGNRGAIGAYVTVYAGGHHYVAEVGCGRGLGMQDPLRLHFGIGPATHIDSVLVRWPGSAYAESFTNLDADRIHVLKSGRSLVSPAVPTLRLTASPNPFTDRIRFTYHIVDKGHVRLEIYSPAGTLVQVLLDEEQNMGDHAVTWEARDVDGHPMPQGAYLYRLVAIEGEVTGKAILGR